MTHLECPKCSKTYADDKPVQWCECGSPLLVRYNLDRVRQAIRKETLRPRHTDLWHFREWIPSSR